MKEQKGHTMSQEERTVEELREIQDKLRALIDYHVVRAADYITQIHAIDTIIAKKVET
jgi:predicted metallo-beta-lactamase superfamily hydrolase